MYGEEIPYKKTEEPKDPKTRAEYWDMAIGLNKVDNLTPSDYLLELSEKNIRGELNINEVENFLTQYYKLKEERSEFSQNENECDLVSTRIVDYVSRGGFSFTPLMLKDIHGYLFNGIYDFAGTYREYNITKDEPILNGRSVEYGIYTKIEEMLNYDFNKAKDDVKKYPQMTRAEQFNNIADFASDIWQVHPFGEGNTRTVGVFIQMYLNNLGFKVSNTLFKENSLYLRNAFVRASYSNIAESIYAEKKYLYKFFDNLIGNDKHELKSRELICAPCFIEEDEIDR